MNSKLWYPQPLHFWIKHLEQFHRISKRKWMGYSESMTRFKHPKEQLFERASHGQVQSDWNAKYAKRALCNYCEKEIVSSSKEEFERHRKRHEHGNSPGKHSWIQAKSWPSALHSLPNIRYKNNIILRERHQRMVDKTIRIFYFENFDQQML